MTMHHLRFYARMRILLAVPHCSVRFMQVETQKTVRSSN